MHGQPASCSGHFLGEELLLPIEWEGGMIKSDSGHFGEQNNAMPVSGIGPHFVGFPARGLVIVPGMLSILLKEEKG